MKHLAIFVPVGRMAARRGEWGKGSGRRGYGMSGDDEDLAKYEWGLGVCFRHPSRGEVETAQLEVLHLRIGTDVPVRACRECVLTLEADRRARRRAAGGQ